MTSETTTNRATGSVTVAQARTGERGCPAPPDTSAAIALPDDDTLAGLAKALAHPARVRILRYLARRQACVTGDIVTEIDLAQSTVSEHLRILREAGIVRGEIEGPRTHYCLDPDGLAALTAGLAALVAPPSRAAL